MSPKTFEEVTAALESRVNNEKRQSFTLDGMESRLEELRIILQQLEHPETQYRTVHVAGTKGKGSTCTMLSSVLQKHGLKVGRYSSPHLYTVRERFSVNGEICSAEEFTELMSALCERIQKNNPELFPRLTYFELTTLFAFVYFARKKVDVAVLETGMGGRLDATNICRPTLTLITSISFDHIEQLGPTLEDIAAEKGGIIKSGVPVLSTARRVEVQKVLHRIAQSFDAPEFFLNDSFTILLEPPQKTETYSPSNPMFCFQTLPERFPVSFSVEHLELTLPGFHQIRNASLAVAAALLLLENVEPEKLRDGLRSATIPARIEFFPTETGKPAFVVDGAHNLSSIRAFIKTVRQRFPHSRMFTIFGTSLGKDVERMLSDLILFSDYLVLTQYSNNFRAFPPQGLKTIISSLPQAPQKFKEEFFLPEPQNDNSAAMEDSVSLDMDHVDMYVKQISGSSKNIKNNIKIEVIENCTDALQFCFRNAAPDDVICVTGSLFLAAELRQFYLQNEGNNNGRF